jgi:16S rRNA processing protein RimM
LTDHAARFNAGAELLLDRMRRRVEWSRPGSGAVVIKLEGIDDRDAAGAQRGRYLEVEAHESPPLPPGSFYHHQLVDLQVRTTSGTAVGRITEIMERPANDVWVVRSGSVEKLVPATREAVLEVDLERRRVIVDGRLVEQVGG